MQHELETALVQAAGNPQNPNQQFIQASLPGSISVDDIGQKQGAAIPQGQYGGGMGNLVSAYAGNNRNQPYQDAAENIQERNTARLGAVRSDELYEALEGYGDASRRFENTNRQRYNIRSKAGTVEALFDMAYRPFARKKMQESRTNLMKQQESYEQQKLQVAWDKEQQKRKDYVKNVLPVYKGENPGMSDEVALGIVTQMAAQDMPVEKVFPEGAASPVREEYLGDGGTTMVRFRNPKTGQILQGEQYAPYIKKGASDKTTGAKNTNGLIYDNDGNEFKAVFGPPDENGKLPILGTSPTGKNVETKPFVMMSPESKKYGAMVANSTTLVASSLPELFDENGDWAGIFANEPASNQKAALLSYKNAIRLSIRPESGAAVPPEEVEAAETMYLPDWSDSSLIAQSKVQRFARYQKRMYDSMFTGFTDVPESLLYVDYMQPWMDTPVVQAASKVVDDEETMDAYQQWLNNRDG